MNMAPGLRPIFESLVPALLDTVMDKFGQYTSRDALIYWELNSVFICDKSAYMDTNLYQDIQ